MNSSLISVRYAKALFLLAEEKSLHKEIYQDFQLVKKVLMPVPEFKAFITSPIVKPENKKKIFTDTFSGKINQMTLDFLIFLVDKNREIALTEIIRMFEKLYRKHFNIKEVIVKTAKPISEETKNELTKMVAEKYNCTAEVVNHVDEDMIGGFNIIIDNQQLDLSVKTQLKEIKKALKSESYKIGL
jgi:F-type H+-transporting ATPase subunit delta